MLDINNFGKTIVHVIRKSHEFNFKIVRVITIVVSNPVNFLVNARPMTLEHCQRILDDVTIFHHHAVVSKFLYSLHPLFLSSSFVYLSYCILAVPMRKCVVKHSCKSFTFPMAILYGTCFFPTATTSVHFVFRTKK